MYVDNKTIINLLNWIVLIKEDIVNIKYVIQWGKKDILNILVKQKRNSNRFRKAWKG